MKREDVLNKNVSMQEFQNVVRVYTEYYEDPRGPQPFPMKVVSAIVNRRLPQDNMQMSQNGFGNGFGGFGFGGFGMMQQMGFARPNMGAFGMNQMPDPTDLQVTCRFENGGEFHLSFLDRDKPLITKGIITPGMQLDPDDFAFIYLMHATKRWIPCIAFYDDAKILQQPAQQ